VKIWLVSKSSVNLYIGLLVHTQISNDSIFLEIVIDKLRPTIQQTAWNDDLSGILKQQYWKWLSGISMLLRAMLTRYPLTTDLCMAVATRPHRSVQCAARLGLVLTIDVGDQSTTSPALTDSTNVYGSLPLCLLSYHSRDTNVRRQWPRADQSKNKT